MTVPGYCCKPLGRGCFSVWQAVLIVSAQDVALVAEQPEPADYKAIVSTKKNVELSKLDLCEYFLRLQWLESTLRTQIRLRDHDATDLGAERLATLYFASSKYQS
jgi:hypothetical protein